MFWNQIQIKGLLQTCWNALYVYFLKNKKTIDLMLSTRVLLGVQNNNRVTGKNIKRLVL